MTHDGTQRAFKVDQEKIRRRHLPHWDMPGAPFFVTTCLEGSIPAQGLLDVMRSQAELTTQLRPAAMTESQWKTHCWKRSFMRFDEWLDLRPARRDLEKPELAQIVVNSLTYFAEERYDLYAYAVMPSHIHWLFQPRSDWIATLQHDERSPREIIVYSFNRFTATKCNRLTGNRGAFWQHESYDHWVRDVDELDRIIRYIEENPVKAGLVAAPDEWSFFHQPGCENT